jgi:hypothetical protein
MIDIDNRVRESLVSQAAHAPDGADLLGAVHARSRRYAVRRRIALGGLAAAVAVLVAVPLLGRLGDGPATLQPADSGTPVVLEKGPQPALTFPLTPTWLPPGLAAPTVHLGSGLGSSLQYTTTAGRQAVSVSIEDRDSSNDPPIADNQVMPVIRPIQVGTKTGKQLAYGDITGPDGTLAVLFERAPGQWVQIHRGDHQLNAADLARIGAGLIDKRLTRPGPFTFELQPRGYVATESNGEALTLAPKGVRTGRQFVVTMQFVTGGELGSGEQVTVGGRPGRLVVADGNYRLRVRLDENQRIELRAPAGSLRRADFLRYAAGVAPKPGVRSQGG